MTTPIDPFRNHFNDVAEQVQRFCIFVRGVEFQTQSIDTMRELETEAIEAKALAVERNLEDEANAYLAFELMAKSLAEELHFYVALKADDADAAWDHLINAQSWAASAMKAHAVASHLDGYINRLHSLEKLLFPQPLFFSSGFIVRNSECSICKSEYGDCSHIKGKAYMGKMCARVIKKADLLEVSVVSDPADKHCRALQYTDNSVTRNVFTQRVVPEKEKEPNQSPTED